MMPGQEFNPYRVFHGIFIPNALVRYTGIIASSKIVYGRLCQYAGKAGVAWPKQETLAEEVGMSVSNVRKCLDALVKAGFIRAEAPTGVDRLKHLPCKYVFLWHAIFEEGAFRSDRARAVGSDRARAVPLHYSEENHIEENQRAVGGKEEENTNTQPEPPPVSNSLCSTFAYEYQMAANLSSWKISTIAAKFQEAIANGETTFDALRNNTGRITPGMKPWDYIKLLATECAAPEKLKLHRETVRGVDYRATEDLRRWFDYDTREEIRNPLDVIDEQRARA